MSWNATLGFSEGLAKLREEAAKEQPRKDRPTTVKAAAIRTAHSVFQPRTFMEDLSKDEAHVRELIRAVKSLPKGEFLDPILVVPVGKTFVCIDGHHRLLAYKRAGVKGAVPVEHFEGSLDDAIKEAIRRNSKDTLAMSHKEKIEAAWRLVVLGGTSRTEIRRVTSVADATIGTMRATLKKLREAKPDGVWDTWREAQRAAAGGAMTLLDEDAWEAIAREWAKRLAKTFGATAARNPRALAEALEMYSEALPKRLIEQWVDAAYEVCEAMDRDGYRGDVRETGGAGF